MTTKTCEVCGNPFETNNNSDVCYGCTLKRITGGLSPEEGDFNSAKIQSGTMSKEDWKLLQQDLRAVEGFSSDMEQEYYEGSQFDDAEVYCLICGKRQCYCDLEYPEDNDQPQIRDSNQESEWRWAPYL